MAGRAPIEVDVPAGAAGERLDRFLATVPGVGTRSQAKQLLDGGLVTVDGVVRKASHALVSGARVVVTPRPPVAVGVAAEPLPLVVLFEDAHLLAIDKPPGMVVHPAPGARSGTVVNAVLHRLGNLTGVGDPQRPGIVHRLDKDTSGVLLVARTAAALAALGRQFRDRTVQKTYVAVVQGRVGAARGTIDRPIGRHPRERKRMSVRTRGGRAALTTWEVVERFPAATVLALHPHTGRTHQLRVHLAALGHPIVGDRVYGGNRRSRAGGPDFLAAFPRQALHAAEIRFAHPASGAPLVVAAPLPPDMTALAAALRAAAATGKASRSA